MFILKHLKTLQHVSIIIQIIFRKLVCSFLKSLILKFVVCTCVLCGGVCWTAVLIWTLYTNILLYIEVH